MKSSHKLSDAVHILAYIELLPNDDLSSAAIARSVESNPSLIRRLMSQLTQAGLLTTQAGKATPKLNFDSFMNSVPLFSAMRYPLMREVFWHKSCHAVY